MSRTARICVVGSTNIDVTFRTPRLPRADETILGHGSLVSCGGKGANQAVMAARLDARVTMVSRVGRDVFGEQALENFRAHSIDTTFVAVDPDNPTGAAAIIVDDDGHNRIIVVPGANQALSPSDIRQAAAAIENVDVLLCQLETPMATGLEATRIAKASGVRTILNPAPAATLPKEWLRLIDICIPNEIEIQALTCLPTDTLEEAGTAARALQACGPKTVIVTLGCRGAVIVDEDRFGHVPSLAVDVVDPTGAGDAFVGSVAVFLAEGDSALEAARKASVIAAHAVTRLGAQAAYPRRQEIQGI